MANRFIKSTIWTSPNLNSLPEEAELLFYRLLPLPDDHGCFVADPRVLKGMVFPIKDSISIDSICNRLISLVDSGIISIWSDSGRVYGVFNNWSKHQQIRAKFKRKTPIPPVDTLKLNDDETRKLLQDIVISCYQSLSVDATLPSSFFPSPSSKQGAASPPNASRDLEAEDREFFNDCVQELKKAVKKWYPGINSQRVGAMAGKAVKKLNRVIKVHPEALVWIVENKMPLPSNPDDWYRFVNRADDTMHKDGKYPNGGLRPPLCHEWASEARHACPLIPRLELRK